MTQCFDFILDCQGIYWIIAAGLVIINASFGTWVTVKLDPNPKLSKMYVQNAPQYGSTGWTDPNQQWQAQQPWQDG